MTTRLSVVRDPFAPGLLFPIAFVSSYAAPYFNLVGYGDLVPPPGARMVLLAAVGLWSYLAGLSLARLAWPATNLPWPHVKAEAWRGSPALILLSVFALVTFAIVAFVLRLGADNPLVGHPLKVCATVLPLTTAIACGLYVLVSRRGLTASNVFGAFLVLISILAETIVGHHGLAILALAPLTICFHYLVRPIRIGALVASVGLIVVALGVANSLQSSSPRPPLEHLIAQSNLPSWAPVWVTRALTWVATGPLTFNLVLSKVPGTEPFQHGMALFDGALGILPGHQATIGEFVSRRLLQLPAGSPGLPPSILGGFYLDFGVAGMAIGMLVVGFLSQFLYWQALTGRSLWSVFLYAYWYCNLFVALHDVLIANDLIWFIPLSILCINSAVISISHVQRRP